jgi:hypothetical protein
MKEEIQEKKQIGNITQTRKGKRGYGRMKTTLDFLSGKEKRAYTKAGKVQVSNLYDELVKKDVFEKLTDEEQKRYIQHWRTKYSVKEIQQGLGIASMTYYRHLERLGIPRERPGRKAKAKTQKIAIEPMMAAEPKELLMFEPEPQPRPKTYMELLEYPDLEKDFPELAKQIAAEKAEPAPAVLLLDGLNVAYNGRYSAEEIQRMIHKIDIILDGEKNEFEIELRISERKGE